MNIVDFLDLVLILAGIANFACICAGVQLPKTFDWSSDLKKLHPFTRKIFLNYYFYVGSIIFAWGVISFYLRKELLAGGPLAIALITMMLIFWLVRIIVDMFFFEAKDWPQGNYYRAGHLILRSTFFCLVIAYSLVLAFILT